MGDTGNFDDLVFENRNKEYGAYYIRKKYNFFLLISLIVALLIGSAVVMIPFLKVILNMEQTTGTGGGGRKLISVQMEKMELPDEVYVAPTVPPPPKGMQQVEKYVAPIIADTVLPTDNIQQSVADVQANNPETTTTQELTVSTDASESELTGGDLGDGSDEPFILVEVKPTFKGGDLEEFRKWVQKRVIYPQEAQDNGISGRVYLTFVIERDGSVSNVKVVRGVDPLINKEAEKAIAASPKWSPGLQRGRPVRVRFSIFLNFTL